VIDQNQINATVEPFTVSGVTGAGAVQTNDQTGEVQRMVLIPYGPLGEAFFIVAFGNAADDQTLQDILNTMVIKRPTPDYAAIDAAWQTSLAEKGSLIYGSPDAPIKLVEYLDFSCSHCADYSTDMDRLIALEVETGHLQVEYKLLDVIGVEYSDRATTAAYCAAAQGKGYVVYETLFRSSRELGPQDAYSAENIKSLLEKPEIGLDMDAWEACINSDTYGDLIAQNDISAQGAGVTGTPAILVGTDAGNLAFMTAPDGSTWTGGIPLPMLRTAIHRAIDDGVSIASVFAPTPTGNQ
jgi:protein-disulfide isomerase